MAQDVRIVGAGGEYMDSATVVSWHKAPGERVRAGELLVTVETAKSATEIEAPCDGVLSEVLAPVGEDVEIGATLGRIDDGSEAPAATTQAAATAEESPSPDNARAPARRTASGAPRAVASPLARRTAAALGVDLATLTGTGPHGRIKRRDVEAAARTTAPASTRGAATAGTQDAAETVVLLHGFGADATSWRQVLPGLRGLATQRPNLPGHGGTPAPQADGLEALVDATARLLAADGGRPVHLVGHSLGGAVALALADTARVAVRSVTLIAPAGLGPEIDGAFLSGFLRATRADSLEPWLRRLVHDPASLPGGLAEAILRARRDTGDGEAQAQLAEALFPDGTQGFDLRPALARLRVPARLVWGRRDAILPWRHALEAPGRVAINLLPDTGHMPHVEAPDTVATLIAETVRSAG